MSALKMNLRELKRWRNRSLNLGEAINGFRFHSTAPSDLKKLRPGILKRIEERSKGKENPVRGTVPVAREVLQARTSLYDGVSTLIQYVPIWSCKYCPEVFIGESGHLIRTCHGYHCHAKNKVHNWVKGSLNDVIVPVETFHLQKMLQYEVKHHERADYDRIPAIVDICRQAGVDLSDITPNGPGNNTDRPEKLSEDELRSVAIKTLRAWETVRSGVRKLMFVHPVRVCKHCSEVHVGYSGHMTRTCGVSRYDTLRSGHLWEKAKLDDLVPPKTVWFRRRQDPPVLLDKGREYYGQAPVVVDLCSKAGALVPSKYFCMMKMDGLTAPADLDPGKILMQKDNDT